MLNNKKFLPYMSCITASIIFGFSFMFSKKALGTAGPFELLSFRFGAAFLTMSLLALLKIIKIDYKNKPLRSLFLLSFTHPFLYFIFETFGIKYGSTLQAGIMLALIPIFVAVLGAWLLKEIPSLKQALFIVLSVAGVMLIIAMGSTSSGSVSIAGTVFLLMAVLAASIYNILSRKLSSDFTPMEITYFMMAFGALFFNLISVADHIKNGTLSSYFILFSDTGFSISILYLGILSSSIAFLLINYSLSKIKASENAVFSNLSTIVSIAAGVLFMNEAFFWYHLAGAALILLGVWGTSYFGGKVNE
ncbi:MAG: permease [Firmicutes bacterium]|nr:permease [Bacillota bacterium]